MICVAAIDLDELIQDHLWIIGSVLSKRLNRPVSATSHPEQWQDGLIALWRAAKRFDPHISTFSTWGWLYVDRLYSSGLRTRAVDRATHDNSPPILRTLPDTRSVPSEIDAVELTGLIEPLIDALPTREADILRRYFGLSGVEPESLDDVATEYGVSRSRVNFQKQSGLKRLRRAVAANPKLDKALRND